jgi:uncharacterized membrane protein YcaP (DUF421 family)
VTEDELRGKLREANVIQMSEVRAVILESKGDVSVIHTRGSEELDDYVKRRRLRLLNEHFYLILWIFF